jgi:CpeT protein
MPTAKAALPVHDQACPADFSLATGLTPPHRRPSTGLFAAVAILWASACVLTGCQAPGPKIDSRHPTDSVADLLVGSFTSAEQAKTDRDFREIHLHAIRVWTARTDGPWIYLEQAVAAEPLKPYRQRFYQIRLSEHPDVVPGTVESRVYELPGDPLAFAGAWSEPARFDAISPDQLVQREGCTVYLVPNTDGSWSGGTDGSGCSSALRGATYATSEVTVTGTELRSWDRGFDKDGKQVWGAEKGPYVFRRADTVAASKPNMPATSGGTSAMGTPGTTVTNPSGRPIGRE